ncbi:unnamed protein product [Spirodela intermedia]|uniref:non-specific serine/threonine protein kinase n=1 Tax=Spirodela intermedia TaxID=51605 RepID=A0A7I8IGG3_SPIIN|nr:unnamed protein product [Spirodela intermedia]CAA6656969.1 unnamed protein product [Spirodela intermedia]
MDQLSLYLQKKFDLEVKLALLTDEKCVNALRVIRTNLTDPRENLESWKHGDPCKSPWTGVMCFPRVANDGYLHVRSLALLNMNLSGQIAPEFGQLSRLEVLDFMWNNISGNIPKEIGKLTSLKLLLLSGNQLSGSIPEELGNLRSLDRFQIDENNMSGPLPKSFANLTRAKHLHMNNNSISGQIPPEFSRLPCLVHLLLDNNKLSGYLPPELSQMPNLLILQLDNNNFSGTSIPASYANMAKLAKLSLRNCGLQGSMPDISGMPYLNFLSEPKPAEWKILANKVSTNITTIDLSNNMLGGSIPPSFTGLRFFRECESLQNNNLIGSVPSFIWQNNSFVWNESVTLLQGNPICENRSALTIVQFCGPQAKHQDYIHESCSDSSAGCRPCSSADFLNTILSLLIGYRLKSPGFSHFTPHMDRFETYLTKDLNLFHYQLYIDSYSWEAGPRLRMQLKFFPADSSSFNISEILRIKTMFIEWNIRNKDFFGPYELLNFTLLGIYSNALKSSIKIDGVKSFTFEEMAVATKKFCGSSQVGQGGYGRVYKGVLADGTSVAVKRAQKDSLQGSKEFFTEIEFLSRLHHRNLVSMVGFCDEEDEQMLVYEFMPNGTLRDHLSGKLERPLNFSMRLHIALGSARGIMYLHTEANPPVFHRDIKASNILLDSKFTARVADFGLSRLAPAPDTEESEKGHISTVVKGTPGYLDPEYILTHQLTDRSDLLTGMRPVIHGKNITREVATSCEAGLIASVVDKKMGPYPVDSVDKFAALALRCCSTRTADRPSISEVVKELEDLWQTTVESSSKDSTMWVHLSTPSEGGPATPSASSSNSNANVSYSLSPR